MGKDFSEIPFEKYMEKNKKTRFKIKLVILALFLIIIALFCFKKNVIPTNFYLKGEKTIELKLGENYKESGFVAKLFGKDISKEVTVEENINYDKIGEYEVNYTLKIDYLNIEKKLSRKVSIVDNIPPELTIECDDTIYWNLGEDFVLASYHASDNIDGDITGKVNIDTDINTDAEGEYNIHLSVKDTSNNETTKDIKVIVEDKWKNTYILVVKSEQMLYYYEKGVLVFSSPVVTGNDYDTPLGDFAINNKMPRARLVGPNNEWDCYVNWWMPFISSSHGFHDSSWRTEFGGNVWTYNPTHGCINLPADKAYEMYQIIEIGTPVHIVH